MKLPLTSAAEETIQRGFCGIEGFISAFTSSGHRSLFMKQGDHVKVIGRDGFYVFLREDQGTATLRAGGVPGPGETTLAIPISRIVSLEKLE
jgi:hypothetical protein